MKNEKKRRTRRKVRRKRSAAEHSRRHQWPPPRLRYLWVARRINRTKATPEASGAIIHPPKTALSALPDDRSVWEGVYTRQQSERGTAVFRTACIRCHGADLLGNENVPTPVGDDFLELWKRKRAGNLFSYRQAEMPPKKKRSASEYADLLAFLLRRNHLPTGTQELPADFIELQAIRMDERREGRRVRSGCRLSRPDDGQSCRE